MFISEMFIRVESPIPGDQFMHPPPVASGYTDFQSVGTDEQVPGSFRPSVAVIIGVLATMFAVTLVLLLYAKHCKRNTIGRIPSLEDVVNPPPLLRDRDTGVDPTIIESLPLFSFTSLQGMKDGLECAVCLCRYEGTDMLRLLPKCKHAFHINCVGAWLHSHSTCPLCRHRVDAEDMLLADEFMSSRKWAVDESFGSRRSSAYATRSSTELEIERVFQFYVHRESELGGSSSIGFGLGSDRRDNFGSGESVTSSLGSGRKDRSGREGKDALLPAHSAADEERLAQRLGHRIVLSDFVFQQRWSDFLPSDVLSLNPHTVPSNRERLSTSEMKSGPRVLTSKVESPRLSAASRSNSPRLSPRLSLSTLSETARLSASKNDSPRVSSSSLVETPRLSYASRAIDPPRPSSSKLSESTCMPPYKNHAGPSKQKSSTESQALDKDLEMGLAPANCSATTTTINTLNNNISKNKPEGGMLLPWHRSYSQFSGLDRFAKPGRNLLASNLAESNPERDERTRKWYAIAKKRLKWVVGRERKGVQQHTVFL